MIDIDRLSTKLANNKAVIDKIMAIFLGQYDKGSPLFEPAMGEGNTEEIYHLAHSLKGALANMCAEDDAALAADIEHLARAGNLPDAEQVADIEQRVQQINTQIKEYMG